MRAQISLCLRLLGLAVSLAAFDGAWAQTSDPNSWRTPEYFADWALDAINAATAYAAGYTGKGVKVGVVDSGFDASNPQLPASRYKPVTITGTYFADGYRYGAMISQDGNLVFRPDDSSRFAAGQTFDVSGAYNPAYNDAHGTHVSGTIAAARDGIGMHGVAFDAQVAVANTRGTDDFLYGPNADYSYFKAAYGGVAASGARFINSSWGSPDPRQSYATINGLGAAYEMYAGRKTYLDAMVEVALNYNLVHVLAAGNDAAANPDIRNSLPFFRPEIERNWLAVGAASPIMDPSGTPIGQIDQPAIFSDLAGVAKYWTVFAPGVLTYSTVPLHINPSGFGTYSGTSMAAPHATGALAILAERFPYLASPDIRDVLLTTAQHRDAVAGTPDANPSVPNEVWGWGTIDLAKAIKGPGQLLGPLTAHLPGGMTDTWSNDISDVAAKVRAQESRTSIAAWELRKTSLGIHGGVTDANRSLIPQLTASAIQAAAPLVRAYVVALFAVRQNPTAQAIQNEENTYISMYLNKRANEINNLYSQNGGLYTPSDFDAYTSSQALFQTLRQLHGEEYFQGLKGEYAGQEAQEAAYATRPREGSLIKDGPGRLILTGRDTYTGPTLVSGGTLSVDGSLVSAVTVMGGGTLGGNGTVGGLSVQAGGVAAPGNSVGTLHVAGNASFAKGSYYAVEVSPQLTADKLVVNGTVRIGGGTVVVTRENTGQLLGQGDVRALLGKRFSVIEAGGGVSGRFDAVTPSFTFIGASLDYGAEGVTLALERNQVSFAALATTRNQAAAAAAAATLGAGAPIHETILANDQPSQLPGAYAALSGEVHASVTGALVQDEQLIESSVLRRLRMVNSQGSAGDIVTASLPETAAGGIWPAFRAPSVWMVGLGDWGRTGSSQGTSPVTRTTGGLMGGADMVFGSAVLGAFGGYTASDLETLGNSAKAGSASVHLGVYGSQTWGALSLRGGGSYTWSDVTTNRSVAFPGFSDVLQAGRSVGTAQLFGELAYGFDLGVARIEPFAQLAYLDVSSSSFRETGGLSALVAPGQASGVEFGTLGIHPSKDLMFWNLPVRASATLGWQHAAGELAGATTLAFRSGGEPFTVVGAPVARDSLVAEFALDSNITQNLTLGVAYRGQIAEKAQDHTFNANIVLKF